MFSSRLLLSVANTAEPLEAKPPLKVLLAGAGFLHQVAFGIKILLEFCAIVIILIACLGSLKRLLCSSARSSRVRLITSLRLELAHSLAFSLEFLLAADLVGTAVSPDWSAVGKLGAIVLIRTFLNYFLEKEVEELEKTANSDN